MRSHDGYLDRWMPTASRRVRLVCRPPTDRAFASVVDRVMAASPTMTMAELEYRLRALYPAVQVRRDVAPESESWYVYRDRGAGRDHGSAGQAISTAVPERVGAASRR